MTESELTKNAADDGKPVGKTLGKNHPDLTLIADAWPTLPAALKAGIVAMVRAAEGA